ncbi:hypothetical protein LTR86_011293, partial [Recurvomyces mirabilis]
ITATGFLMLESRSTAPCEPGSSGTLISYPLIENHSNIYEAGWTPPGLTSSWPFCIRLAKLHSGCGNGRQDATWLATNPPNGRDYVPEEERAILPATHSCDVRHATITTRMNVSYYILAEVSHRGCLATAMKEFAIIPMPFNSQLQSKRPEREWRLDKVVRKGNVFFRAPLLGMLLSRSVKHEHLPKTAPEWFIQVEPSLSIGTRPVITIRASQQTLQNEDTGVPVHVRRIDASIQANILYTLNADTTSQCRSISECCQTWSIPLNFALQLGAGIPTRLQLPTAVKQNIPSFRTTYVERSHTLCIRVKTEVLGRRSEYHKRIPIILAGPPLASGPAEPPTPPPAYEDY